MGARGTLSLYKDVFDQPVALTVEKSQGRSKELIAKRNDCLIDRYFYYGNFVVSLHGKIEGKLNYPSILLLLQEEFFINSEFTIPQVIDECYDRLIELRNQKPAKEFFKKKWPHLVW